MTPMTWRVWATAALCVVAVGVAIQRGGTCTVALGSFAGGLVAMLRWFAAEPAGRRTRLN